MFSSLNEILINNFVVNQPRQLKKKNTVSYYITLVKKKNVKSLQQKLHYNPWHRFFRV